MVVFIGLYAGAIISSEYRKFKDKKKGNNNIVEAPKEDYIKENYNNINNKNGPVGSNLGDRGAIIESGYNDIYGVVPEISISPLQEGPNFSPTIYDIGNGNRTAIFNDIEITRYFMGEFGLL